ncbi:C40 family peptidase [Streptomyces sp. GZWMJZ-114]|uniref:C40 family peptidase n=1 Tax=Streptomyces sp. GZWMJZ-114 TaxID=2494734 RepID=UPI0019D6BC7C|nr:C40 family peptidase [Streptomyces sp. GZWMJZ-114]
MVWTGITNPDDGIVGEIGRVLRGEKKSDALKSKATTKASDLATAILVTNSGGGGNTGGGGATQAGYSGGGIVGVARSALGTPYVWGGGNAQGATKGGFDCSGLAQYAYAKGAGISIPRTTGPQQAKASRISESQAVAGDLVFFGMPAYHVGIYLGGGRMIHAPHTGTVVREESVSAVTPGPVTYGRFRKAVAAA